MAFFTRSRAYNGVSVEYDGIDIDWEPIGPYGARYQSLITKLRAALTGLNRPIAPLLTTAVPTPYADPSVVAIVSAVQSSLDQINVMTYPYGGTWSVWHISPVGSTPSVNDNMPEFAASIPASKLGFGIDFDALQFEGFTAPSPNSSTNEPDAQIETDYRDMMALYYPGQPGPTGTSSDGMYQWDATANAAYLSISATSSSPGYFVTFENETSIQKKVSYAKTSGYGGVIVWELAEGFRPDMPVGHQDGLMQALKAAALVGSATPAPTAIPTPAPTPAPTATPMATATPTSTPTPTPTFAPNIAPTVVITSPASGTLLGRLEQVQVSTGPGVTNVALYVNGSLVSTSSTAPFTIAWSPPIAVSGTAFTLTTKAYNAAGAVATSAPVRVYR
jgi:chitinase